MGVVGLDEAAGKVDQAADAAVILCAGRCGDLGGKAERKVSAEGDADERDARGVDGGVGGDVVKRGAESVDPERDVVAVHDGLVVGALGAGAVEVVRREERDAGAGDEWADAREPPVDVAAGAVEKDDGRDWSGGRGKGGVEADGRVGDEDGFLHDWKLDAGELDTGQARRTRKTRGRRAMLWR